MAKIDLTQRNRHSLAKQFRDSEFLYPMLEEHSWETVHMQARLLFYFTYEQAKVLKLYNDGIDVFKHDLSGETIETDLPF